eukprot:1157624-Pelagomonas_calceolata.AAC.7
MAATRPNSTLTGTATPASMRVSLMACRKSGSVRHSKNTANPLWKACTMRHRQTQRAFCGRPAHSEAPEEHSEAFVESLHNEVSGNIADL